MCFSSTSSGHAPDCARRQKSDMDIVFGVPYLLCQRRRLAKHSNNHVPCPSVCAYGTIGGPGRQAGIPRRNGMRWMCALALMHGFVWRTVVYPHLSNVARCADGMLIIFGSTHRHAHNLPAEFGLSAGRQRCKAIPGRSEQTIPFYQTKHQVCDCCCVCVVCGKAVCDTNHLVH